MSDFCGESHEFKKQNTVCVEKCSLRVCGMWIDVLTVIRLSNFNEFNCFCLSTLK